MGQRIPEVLNPARDTAGEASGPLSEASGGNTETLSSSIKTTRSMNAFCRLRASEPNTFAYPPLRKDALLL